MATHDLPDVVYLLIVMLTFNQHLPAVPGTRGWIRWSMTLPKTYSPLAIPASIVEETVCLSKSHSGISDGEATSVATSITVLQRRRRSFENTARRK